MHLREMMDGLLWPLCRVLLVWAYRRERAITREGTPLTEFQRELARMAGVARADAVFISLANQIPVPLPALLRRLAARVGLISPHLGGMTLGHGIALRSDCRHDARLLIHELTHVAQVERLGGLAPFMKAYVRECVWPGYPRGPLEREARAAESQFGEVDGRATPDEDVLPYDASKKLGFS